ncbi:MarR family winged helix-turn-helix transcriptional regulator [Salinarimonas rosea]|uniref:MarR family winged helix-turn-helix transcriptional regulator n=1 Tax=Salinarimonas rosea TaxID=552063 RepID=UPI001FDA98F3|nr:MarR family winged helix-turn-helix transcriptional regulator [Salinarimonas rosea]
MRSSPDDMRAHAPRDADAPVHGAEPLTLERFLPYRLNVLATTVSNALARIYAERFGITIPQWRIVATLGQFETRTARDIAAHAVMHKSTVSRAVASLAGRGIVERRPNADDMREELLALTPKGRGIYEAVAPEALAFERAVFTGLSPDERETLFGLIDRLDARMRSLAPDLDPADASEVSR